MWKCSIVYFSRQLILQEVFISKIPEIIDRDEPDTKKIVLTDIFTSGWKKNPLRKTVNFTLDPRFLLSLYNR